MSATITIDIDTGGTFTDAFVVREGVGHAVKVLTTPHDLTVCFREVIAAAAQALELDVSAMLRSTAAVRYSTTVGTNAVIQRRGPRLGLVTDVDLPEDAAGIGTFTTPELVHHAAPGSTNGDGPAAPMRRLLESGARGLVASFDAPAGGGTVEPQVRTAFEQHHPLQCLDTVPLLLAGEVSSDRDPVRRTATALFNAYVHPDVADYLYRAEDHLRQHGYRRPLLVVHNDGGASRVARTIAGKTYNSGPMAGLAGAAEVARSRSVASLVTLDMGGTSLDIGFVRDGHPVMREHGRVEGVEVAFPLPDLVPLGAGGGSIAWLDGDRLRVGPQSAGAAPGPACFGFGGDQPTVTDADVVAGVLRPAAFMGGRMELDVDAARRALTPLADALGCSVEQAAVRVRATVHADSGRRLAAELGDRGIDPAEATVFAFGGNGATHGAAIAAAAGVPEVLTSPLSPVFSAFGASTIDVRHRYEQLAEDGTVEALRERAARDMRGEGFAADQVDLHVAEEDRDGARWTVLSSVAALPRADLRNLELGIEPAADAPPDAPISWGEGPPLPSPVHDAARMTVGDEVVGPALIDAGSTTCAIPPGWALTVLEGAVHRLRQRPEVAR